MTKWNGQMDLLLTLVALTISCSLCLEPKRVIACVNCGDLNREKNAKVDCPKEPSECGECIKGTTRVSWDDSCIPIDLEFVVKPKNVSGVIGKSVMMICEFNYEAICEWIRQGSIVNTRQDNYKPTFINGLPSKNCSLEITPFLKDDAGYWQCQGQTTFDKVTSFPPVFLTISESVIVMEYPKHEIVQYKKKVTLNCKFNIPVQCQWLHKGRPVFVKSIGSGAYKYIDQTNTDKREDCSIMITSFNKKDAGNWQCRNVPINRKPRVESYDAVLYGSKPNKRKGKCLGKGENIILHCYMDGPGKCSWKKKDNVVKISGRYKYVNEAKVNDNLKMDCSIIISKFQEFDVGEWKCEKNANDVVDGLFANRETPCAAPLPKTKKITRRSIHKSLTDSDSTSHPKVQVYPTSGNYYLDDTVILECKFNKAISQCFWLRNEHNLDIEHRYSYMDGQNGQNTTDCTIEISQFQEIDIGEWICGSVTDDEHEGVKSKPSFLDFINPELEVQYEPSDMEMQIIPEENEFEKVQSNRPIFVRDNTSTIIIAVAATLLIIFLIVWVVGLFVWIFRNKPQGRCKNETSDCTNSLSENEKLSGGINVSTSVNSC